MTQDTTWLQLRPTIQQPRLRLFCLPHAGGGAAAFHAWSAALPSGIQVAAILLPGRETRIAESPYDRIDPLVDAIARQMAPWLDTPFAVFGHSMGALLAFEWVRRLAAERQPMPVHLFLSGRRAPDIAMDDEPLRLLPDREFIDRLILRYRGIPDELLRNPELMEIFLPILRADIGVVESHLHRPCQPLDCPITVAAGIADDSVDYTQLMAWKRQTSRRFHAHLFPGGHFYPHGPMLKMIAATLAAPAA